MNIETRVKKIIASQLNINLKNITNNSSLAEDLGADSLDTVEIIMAMEEEFNQEFQDDHIKINNVQDVIDYIERTIKPAA